MAKNELIKRLNDKQSVIGIVGLGYVGLPLMLRYQEVGYRVLGLDIDQTKVDRLNKGETYIAHIRPRPSKRPGPAGLRRPPTSPGRASLTL